MVLSPIVCGVLGYVSIILYDLNNTSHEKQRPHTVAPPSVPVCNHGLAFLTPSCPAFRRPIPLPAAVRIIAGVLALGFRATHIPHPHRPAGAGAGSAGTPKNAGWEKDLVTTGATRSLPPSECLGDALFSVCCSFRRRTLIRGAPPLSACAVCCWQCMRTSMFSRCSCAGTTPTKDTTPFLFPPRRRASGGALTERRPNKHHARRTDCR